MKIKQIFPFVLASAVLVSCKDSSEFDVTDNGLEYKIYNGKDDAVKVKDGDFITFDLISKTSTDSVLISTSDIGQPIMIKMAESKYKGDLMEGFKLLSVGDSATFMINADSFYVHYEQQPRPSFIAAGSNLKFDVVLRKIQSEAEVKSERKAMAQKMMDQEKESLNLYLAANKVTVNPTASGLYFVETKKGKGKKAEMGKEVKVHYTGMLLDGNVFDSSVDRGEPFTFKLGKGEVIPGWEEGISMMTVGSKATLIIPSAIAYGDRGAGGVIPPFASLIFNVELLDVK
jgi:FKBP-type peptidyl-prolyl cis-trans isomerase FkpA